MWVPATFRGILFISIFPLLWGIYNIQLQTDTREDFKKTNGEIVFLSDNKNQESNSRTGKMRYIAVNSYPGLFEVFIGKDKGDFSPKYENIDSLHDGEWVSIYYSKEGKSNINYSAMFIDKEQVNYYERGNKYFLIGMICILGAIIVDIMAFYYKKKGKIPS
jgi:hypothetical protein